MAHKRLKLSEASSPEESQPASAPVPRLPRADARRQAARTFVVTRHAIDRYLTRLQGADPATLDCLPESTIQATRTTIHDAATRGRLLHERTSTGDRLMVCEEIRAALVLKDGGGRVVKNGTRMGKAGAWRWMVATVLDLDELRRVRDEWTERVNSAIERLTCEEKVPVNPGQATALLQQRVRECRERCAVLRIEVERLRERVEELESGKERP